MINPNDITTVRVGELPIDAITSTAKFPFETADNFLKQNTIQALIDYLSVQASAIQYQIIDMWVTESYIATNLDITGLGINALNGYALCNGQNGTPNLDGQTTIGYGTNYPNIGGFGGSKDAVVVEHSHEIKYAGTSTGTKYPETPYIGDTIGGNMQGTETVGVSGTNKNMQPYMVALKIMKL